MEVTPQAIFNSVDVLAVDDTLVEELKRRALVSPTGRYRLCLHQSIEDDVQEMVIVHCRGNYSRPHRHPNAASTILMVSGEMSCVMFDNDGLVTEQVDMAPSQCGQPFILRIAANRWHMPLCRSEQAGFFETMKGPFDRKTVNQWASWSPTEGDHEAVVTYLKTFAAE